MRISAKSGIIHVLFLGSPYWCNYLISLFNERNEIRAYGLRKAAIWSLKSNKAVCLVGIGPPDTCKRWIYYWATDLLFSLGIVKLKSIFWIGTDVTKLTSGIKTIHRYFNFAGSPWLAKEIINLGYECDTCFFPVKINLNTQHPWPQCNPLRVLCYIPDDLHDLHGSAEIVNLAIAFPDVQFNVVGGTGLWCRSKPGNMVFLGWRNDINNWIDASHILLRRTKHDSFSAFVREGIVANRYVIFTCDVPGVIYVQPGNYNGLCKEFTRLHELSEKGELHQKDNNDAIKLLDYEFQISQLENIFKRQLSCTNHFL